MNVKLFAEVPVYMGQEIKMTVDYYNSKKQKTLVN